MARDWKNETDYDYTKDHTPELWAWEFLRRNPDYRNDWEIALSSSCYKESDHPETLSFKGGRSKWGLLFDHIIDPNVEKPSVDYPYCLFYTYGYYYDKEDLNSLPDLKKTEVLALIDLAKPIPQQLDHFKALLEEDQNYSIAYSDLHIPTVKNKPIYWKDYIRLLDAIETNARITEIASIIFPHKSNSHPDFNGNKSVRDSHAAAKKIRDENYLKILQKPSEWKKR